MKTRNKVYKSDIPEKTVPPSNIASNPPKNTPESGVLIPPFEAKSQKEGEFTRKVIAYFVNDNGEIAWDRMRGATKDELREFVKRPDTRKNLGIEAESDSLGRKPGEPEFAEDEANALFDLLQSIERIAASRFYKVPVEITSQAFTFTADHRKKLGPVYIRLMNKWGPLALKKWKDEIGAAILTLSVVNAQIQVMHILEEKRKRNPAGSLAGSPSSAKVTSISDMEEKKEVDLTASPADTLSAS
jgi:hypothetical protein